jgi:hypothetical protein
MGKLMMILSKEEIQSAISYPLICETMCGSRWGTGKRRREWVANFTDEERKACSKLKNTAYDWYCRKGVPDKVMMYPQTFELWGKLEAFCASL